MSSLFSPCNLNKVNKARDALLQTLKMMIQGAREIIVDSRNGNNRIIEEMGDSASKNDDHKINYTADDKTGKICYQKADTRNNTPYTIPQLPLVLHGS